MRFASAPWLPGSNHRELFQLPEYLLTHCHVSEQDQEAQAHSTGIQKGLWKYRPFRRVANFSYTTTYLGCSMASQQPPTGF